MFVSLPGSNMLKNGNADECGHSRCSAVLSSMGWRGGGMEGGAPTETLLSGVGMCFLEGRRDKTPF